MRYLSYEHNNEKKYGILKGDTVYRIVCSQPDLDGYVASGMELSEEKIVSTGEKTPLAHVRLLSPFTRDMHMLCVGLNYVSHAEEFEKAMKEGVSQDETMYFIKRVHGCLGDGESLVSRPDLDKQCDYETELGIIIGKEMPPGSSIDQDTVFGYTIINDFTSRMLQKKYKQYALGKSLDTYCAMGPVIVTPDELCNPSDLYIRGYKNGELVQDSRTSLMRRNINGIISDLNQGMTLHRGDVIATGTPSGVAVGKNNPLAFLKEGDVFRCEIEGIGTLENPVTRFTRL